jgi:hypothetical protein
MSSAAQIAANQANARKSTGPRTAEGKARSSRNHTTHGLRSKEFVIAEGQQQDFDSFMTALRNDIQPVGALEFDLFTQLAHASWTLRRCRGAEAAMQNRGAAPALDPLLNTDTQDLMRLIDLYARRAERSYARLLREIKSLQTNRQFRGECSGDVSIDDEAAPLSNDLTLQKPRILESRFQGEQAIAEMEARERLLLAPPPGAFGKPVALPKIERTNPIAAPAPAQRGS